MKARLWLRILLAVASLIPACDFFTGGNGPAGDRSSADLSRTPTATASATRTPTRTPTPTSSITPTPLPDAVVLAPSLSIYAGPAYEYERLGSAASGDRLEVIGHFDDCSWLKIITPDQTTGWVFAYVTNLEFIHACSSLPGGAFRPFNGSIILDNRPWLGWGTVKVINRRVFDTVVVLTYLDEDPVIALYVRGEESFTIGGFPDDDYLVFYSTGTDWDGVDRQFARIFSLQRFLDSFSFGTRISGPMTTYSIWTITFAPEAEGNAESREIQPSEFPELN